MGAETSILQRIRLALGGKPGVRLFRNQIGVADYGDGHRIPYGLHPGSADLIGWRTVTVTPDMVGQRIAVFLSIEVKSPSGAVKPSQENWCDAVRDAGGLAGVARSVEEAEEILHLCGGA